jgi:hypothetical protein
MIKIFVISIILILILIIVLLLSKRKERFESSYSCVKNECVPMYTSTDTCNNSCKSPSVSGINKLPDKNVLWTYLCGSSLTNYDNSMEGVDADLSKDNSLVKFIENQYINYIAIGFLSVTNKSEFTFNTNIGCKTNYSNVDNQLQTLHDKGVCITASIGGEGSSTMYKNMTDPETLYNSFIEIRKTYKWLDGIDFDIEAKTSGDYPDLGIAINKVAKLFKKNKFVVTCAPTSSQITPGCGGNASGWGQSIQALINLNMDYIDGMMIQWYEGGSENGNGGQSPLTAQGIVNFYIALSGDKTLGGYKVDETSNANNPPIVGACTPINTTQTVGQYTKCDNQICYTFPTSKLAIGFQTYSPNPICGTPNNQWGSGQYTAQILYEAIDLLHSYNIEFLGIASWAVYNVYCEKAYYLNIFPKVYEKMTDNENLKIKDNVKYINA